MLSIGLVVEKINFKIQKIALFFAHANESILPDYFLVLCPYLDVSRPLRKYTDNYDDRTIKRKQKAEKYHKHSSCKPTRVKGAHTGVCNKKTN